MSVVKARTKKKSSKIDDRQFVFNSDNIDEIIEKRNNGIPIPRHMNPWFKNQVGVRRNGCPYEWTQDEIDEYVKCATDIHYFSNNYCKIKTEDGQVRQMKLRDYQYRVLDMYTKNRFTINMSSRQTGKTITAAIALLHYCIFNTNKGCMIVANKGDTVIEIIDKIKNIYKLLPFFLKAGIVNWNQKNIVFENGCRIKSQARSKEPAIGFTIDFLYMDEFAHIPRNIINHYYKAAIPTVSSIKGSKIVITSTPNGANLFKDLVLGSMLPEGHPEKNMYKLIKVLWWQVPNGNFDDGTIGTRMDPQIYLQKFEMQKHNIKPSMVYEYLNELGWKWAKRSETTDTGERTFIKILHTEDTDIEKVRKLSINGVPLLKFAIVTNWKEEEVKLIGGEEAFNQEYNIQFIAGSKRVLSANKAKELDERTIKYKHVKIDELDKRLKFPYDEFRISPDLVIQERNKYYWLSVLDTSEGLGQDDSVINMFRLMVRDEEWLKKNKLRNMYEAFYFKQSAIYNYNKLTADIELPELYYLLHFEWLDPNRVKTIVELNSMGSTFIASLPQVFNSNNLYGNYIFVRYRHREGDKIKKVGIKTNRNKLKMVKSYIDAIESDKLYVDEEQTLDQMNNFIKVETRNGNYTYQADAGHDDIVMTNVLGSTFFETQDFQTLCYAYYLELPKHIQDLIDNSIDGNYNADTTSYKSVKGAMGKVGNNMRSGKFSSGKGSGRFSAGGGSGKFNKKR